MKIHIRRATILPDVWTIDVVGNGPTLTMHRKRLTGCFIEARKLIPNGQPKIAITIPKTK